MKFLNTNITNTNYRRKALLLNTYTLMQQGVYELSSKQELKVFNYSQTQNAILKSAYDVSDNCKIFKKIVLLNTKQGLKLKTIKTLHSIITYIHNQFITYDKIFSSEHPNYNAFFNFSRTFTNEFYKSDFFFRYIYINLELLFLIKKIKPKKKTKKKKVQPKTVVSYLNIKSRANVTTRIINAYLNNFNESTRINRVGGAILYLMMSGKESFLYKKKISMYNKLLEKKKFY